MAPNEEEECVWCWVVLDEIELVNFTFIDKDFAEYSWEFQLLRVDCGNTIYLCGNTTLLIQQPISKTHLSAKSGMYLQLAIIIITTDLYNMYICNYSILAII